MKEKIIIKGARENNLKNISIEIPKNKIVVITGVSGSGKSTLAFETIYAEGQRKYVESLSAYARQFLQIMNKPNLDSIEGLSPAIAIDQKTVSKNPRSTVGTVTEVYDYIRLLYARIGIPYSPTTGKPITKQTSSEIVKKIKEYPNNKKIFILSPIVRSKKGEFKKELIDLKKKGFQRLFINKKLYELDNLPTLNKNYKYDIDLVIDRLITGDDLSNRLADSVELALSMSNGIVYVLDVDENKREIFSANFSCPVSGFTIEEIEPRIFSFNSPFGACKICEGLGEKNFFDPDLLIPNKKLSITNGAILPWKKGINNYYYRVLNKVMEHTSLDLNIPFDENREKDINVLLYGSDEILIEERRFSRFGKRKYKPFKGIIDLFEQQYKYIKESWMKDEYDKYISSKICKGCNGMRLNEMSLSIKINNENIGKITNLSIEELLRWVKNLQEKLSGNDKLIAKPILREIDNRLTFLCDVGLDYLSLSRSSSTLSGGESQRIRLASQIGSGLTGVLYVLDEPSIGLHQKDNTRLLKTLTKLKKLNNSVIVVEHDEDAIKSADHIIDIGPKAGLYGGEIVAQGNFKDIINNKKSLTSLYLSRKKVISVPEKRRMINSKKVISFKNVSTNNLKNINLNLPLGLFCCISGVSGSGKSSLIIDTLYPALSNLVNKTKLKEGKYKTLLGTHFIDKVVNITQSPIGRTPRSNPVTYTGAFTPIREWFALLPESKERGYKSGRFSFNVKGGRCEACGGDGLKKVEMHFLSDVYVKCEECEGKRFNTETLEVKYKNNSISDVLELSVDEAKELFKAIPTIASKLQMLSKVGLGYIKIGQSATTLSGGEAQRIKIAKELSKKPTGKTLYILDEPTTGLHFEDVNKLVNILQELTNNGNTVIVIEHNLDVLKCSDWIIDLGLDGGDKGGYIITEGPPEKVAKMNIGYTSEYLKKSLSF
ncbi:MAG: excinuclease ABC subunit A [Pelagibacterales bacterium]|nr:excinuclease ABC subunit A [Pelagibacterales bacterium]|tara:strand:- start:15857 stop:18682 length:2826 start_codon:yes stop_codon:yes gene_type:complete